MLNIKEVCGCGECDDCHKLTQNILANQTADERAFDAYVTRFPKDWDDDDDED